ncbi:hypothetical protein OH492_20650 [Vibrio chagasii]|nr:hypothetical protein [Vibrio chagasii]
MRATIHVGGKLHSQPRYIKSVITDAKTHSTDLRLVVFAN